VRPPSPARSEDGWRRRLIPALAVCGAVLAVFKAPAIAKEPAIAKVPDLSASLAPIGLRALAEQHRAYFWLDLENQGTRPQALCGDPSVMVVMQPGPRDPSEFFGYSVGNRCGGLGSENLVVPGGHLIVGLRMSVTAAMQLKKISRLDVHTDTLNADGTTRADTLTPDGSLLPEAERTITIELTEERLRRLPRFADLPVISTSRANGATSFGGWSALVRKAGNGGTESRNPSYWISLVNERKERKAVCRFLEVGVKILAGEKEIRTVTEGRVERNECADNVGVDSGWRLVGPGQAFTFLFRIEPKAGDPRGDRLAFTIQGAESSSTLEQPFSVFSIEAIVDPGTH
jgi:hypothetical protein